MGLTDRIKALSHREVEVGGLHWRVRKISSIDVAQAGHALLLAIPDDVAGEVSAIAAAQASDTPAGRASGKAMEAAVAYAEHVSIIVRAGVVAASEDGETWEPLRVVEGDTDGEAGSLAYRDLPPDVPDVLYETIWSLSTGGEDAGRALREFRPRAKRAAHRG